MFYRKKNNISLSILVMVVQSFCGLAQTAPLSADSSYSVEGVVVEGLVTTRVSMDQSIDSAAVLMDNAIGIGGLLKYHSLVFVKDYGPGNISSVSARGGSASQSQVFWNGININQAGLGMTDLSTLPPFLLDEITVQQSASGAASGSGSMAGNILLVNRASSTAGWHGLLKQTFSSIGERTTGLRVGYSHKKLAVDVRYVYLNSDNTYRFINTKARPYEKEETQHHAGFLQQGYSLTAHYTLSDDFTLSAYSWYTQFDRNIAPTLQTITKVHQQDQSWRNAIQLRRKKKRSEWEYKLAYLKDTYGYTQRSAGYYSIVDQGKGATDNLVNQLTYAQDLGQHIKFNAGVTSLYQTIANQQFAQGTKSLHRFSFFAGLKWSSKNKFTTITVLAREEWYAENHTPFIYSAQVDQCLTRNVALFAKGERHYRIPTLNDLYWSKGGNPSLLPEDGWGAEVGITHVLKISKLTHTMTADLFTRSIDHWILWIPLGGEYSGWTAQNVNEVWSRGVEFKNNLTLQFTPKASFTFSFKHTYQRTTQQDRYAEEGEVYQKQLMYTPVFLGNAGLVMQYKQFALSYYHQYTSWVFIQTDESDFIDPYAYAMLRVQGGHTIGKNKVDVFVELDNCWNSTYQTVKDRPMPLRYYRAGLIYKWN